MDTPRLAIVALAAVVASSALLAAQSAAPSAGQSAARPKLIVPNSPDIRIETRRTNDSRSGIVMTEVLHLKGARQRREERIEATPNDPPNWAQGMTLARISQCDERRMLLLNHDAKTYVYEPIADPGLYMASGHVVDGGRQAAPRRETSGQTITVTIDAVDTGERKQFGRYVARHVITTRTTEEPAPGGATVHRQDGWYIDAPEPNCASWHVPPEVFLGLTGSATSPPRLVINRRGNGRRGYPIEETNHLTGRYATNSRIELVGISESPLDEALFTVPPDYRPALPHPYGGYDLTKPDTLLNRLQAFREVAADWANYIRRYGLLGILPGTQPPARY
jgi:hypothetical protein